MNTWRLVILESPYAGPTQADIERNVSYARAATNDCVHRWDSPIASHLLFTQPGILRDDIPEERRLGIEAGLAWGQARSVEGGLIPSVVYVDLGVSRGMMQGVERAIGEGRPVEIRSVPEWAPATPDQALDERIAGWCALAPGLFTDQRAGAAPSLVA